VCSSVLSGFSAIEVLLLRARAAIQFGRVTVPIEARGAAETGR
jgi:hypothetical protein